MSGSERLNVGNWERPKVRTAWKFEIERDITQHDVELLQFELGLWVYSLETAAHKELTFGAVVLETEVNSEGAPDYSWATVLQFSRRFNLETSKPLPGIELALLTPQDTDVERWEDLRERCQFIVSRMQLEDGTAPYYLE